MNVIASRWDGDSRCSFLLRAFPPEQTPVVEVEDVRAVALQREPEEESELGSAGRS